MKMNNYQIRLLALQEARWTGSGKQSLDKGNKIMWSGHQDDIHSQVVALIMDKEAAQVLMEWKPVNECGRLNSTYVNSKNVDRCDLCINGIETLRTSTHRYVLCTY